MPICFCTLCGKEFEVSIHDVWTCPECEIGAADFPVTSFEPKEMTYLLRQFEMAKESVLNTCPSVQGAVFTAFLHESHLSEPLLDLFIIFFNRVILYIDTFNIDRMDKAFLDKLDAYIENGYVMTYNHYGQNITPIGHRNPDVDLSKITPPIMNTNWGIPIPGVLNNYLQKYSEMQSCADENNANTIALNDATKVLPWWNDNTLNKEDRLKVLKWNNCHIHVLNRLNGFTMLCDILGCNALLDEYMFKFKTLKYKQDFDHISEKRLLALSLISWYSDIITKYPKFKKPETMVKFRKEIGPEDFLNCIVNEYTRLSCKDNMPVDIIVDKIKHKLSVNLNTASAISGEKYQTKKIILSGLIATLGNLVGGVLGGIVGGIGSSAITIGAEHFDKKRAEHWATFFVSK